MKGFFDDLPGKLEEAAFTDGATPFQAFRRICLPVALPGSATVAILAFVFVFQRQLVRGLNLGAGHPSPGTSTGRSRVPRIQSLAVAT